MVGGTPAREGAAGGTLLGWAAIAAVTAAPLVDAARLLARRPQVTLSGDLALIQLGADRAAHLAQLTGPYSREGFHHLGPVVLYLLAPFAPLLGPGGAGLYLGAVVLNGAALAVAVACIWRRHGPLAALAAAAVIDVWSVLLGAGTLREPWNPYLVVAPMLLFVVLWSDGVTGSGTAAVWAVAVGSYEVQTEVATAGFVVAMLGALGLAAAARRRRAGRSAGGAGGRRWSPGVTAGVAVVAALWVAPVVELWRDHPDNARLLWSFAASPHASPPLAAALRSVAEGVTVLPFGTRDYRVVLHRSAVQLALGAALVLAGALATLAGARRRRTPAAGALVAAALAGPAVGAVSLATTAGPASLYLVAWLAYVPAAVLLAAAVALAGTAATAGVAAGAAAGRPGAAPLARRASPTFRARRRAALAAGVAAAVLAGVAVSSAARAASVAASAGAGPWPAALAGTEAGRVEAVHHAALLVAAADRAVRPGDRQAVLTIGDAGLWPYAAAIVLGLHDRGVATSVRPGTWALYFGASGTPAHAATLRLALEAPPRPGAATSSPPGVLARTGDAVLVGGHTGNAAGPQHRG